MGFSCCSSKIMQTGPKCFTSAYICWKKKTHPRETVKGKFYHKRGQTFWSSSFKRSPRAGWLKNCTRITNKVNKAFPTSNNNNKIHNSRFQSTIKKKQKLTAVNQKSGIDLISSFLLSYTGFRISLYFCSISRTLSLASSLI